MRIESNYNNSIDLDGFTNFKFYIEMFLNAFQIKKNVICFLLFH